jgi:hypothetical protein
VGSRGISLCNWHNLGLGFGVIITCFGRATLFIRLLTLGVFLLVLIAVVRIRVTCGKWGTALNNVRAVANATNKSADMAGFRGRETYLIGLARAGAITETARRSVAKRDARIVCCRIKVFMKSGWDVER